MQFLTVTPWSKTSTCISMKRTGSIWMPDEHKPMEFFHIIKKIIGA